MMSPAALQFLVVGMLDRLGGEVRITGADAARIGVVNVHVELDPKTGDVVARFISNDEMALRFSEPAGTS